MISFFCKMFAKCSSAKKRANFFAKCSCNQRHNVNIIRDRSKAVSIRNYQICRFVSINLVDKNEFSGCIEEHFSVNKSLANFVIVSKKNILLLNKTLYSARFKIANNKYNSWNHILMRYRVVFLLLLKNNQNFRENFFNLC